MKKTAEPTWEDERPTHSAGTSSTARTIVAAVLLLFASVAPADIDVSDIDDELMRTMDDTIKSLEPYLSAKNGNAGREGAQLLHDGLKWTEEYFVAKGGPADAVQLAQEGQRHATEVLQALASDDFTAAIDATRRTEKTCRSCHDIYKP